MEIYNFLLDENILQNFVTHMLADLTEDECYMLLLCVRRKYLISNQIEYSSIGNTEVMRREIISDKTKLIRKIKELCVIKGLYTDKNGNSIPEQAFAVYITINPKSYRKAAIISIKDLLDKIADNQSFRLDNLIKNNIHKALSRKIYIDLDVDLQAGDDLNSILTQIKDILGNTKLFIIKTKNGAHVLFKKETLDNKVKKTFYQALQDLSKSLYGEIEIKTDDMLPIPGTHQGGFMPYFIQ